MATAAEEDGGGCESLSHRAEVFRSKLIEDFQILDCITEEGREKAPVYNSSDAASEKTYTHQMMQLLSNVSLLPSSIYTREVAVRVSPANGELQGVQERPWRRGRYS